MQRLEVSGAVRPIYGSLVVKRLKAGEWKWRRNDSSETSGNTGPTKQRHVWKVSSQQYRCEHPQISHFYLSCDNADSYELIRKLYPRSLGSARLISDKEKNRDINCKKVGGGGGVRKNTYEGK